MQVVVSLLYAAAAAVVSGCSDFRLNSSSAQVVSARTMDFIADLESTVEIVPRNTLVQEPIVAHCPACPDYSWRTKYGFVALNTFRLNLASDGLNEKGLSAASLYLPGSEFPAPDMNAAPQRPIVSWVVTYILANYATVDQVKVGLENDVQVVGLNPQVQGITSPSDSYEDTYPLHFPVHDAAGNSIVIEFLNGTMHIYDNPAGVLTNEPPFLEQLALVAAHDKDDGARDTTFKGGYTPVERFQRLTFLNRHAAADMINTVAIPTACVKAGEATEYTLVRDHKLRRLYTIDFNDASNRRAIDVNYGDWSVDVTHVLLESKTSSKDMPPRSIVQNFMLNPALLLQLGTGGDSTHPASHAPVFWIALVGGVAASVVVKVVLSRFHRRRHAPPESSSLL
ncbi:hypothetical protein AC1031_013169 [Aphanomyces cochlioides]|nr:hypothetical protein AC1031_013169 [Aphanomyces cochlioides]